MIRYLTNFSKENQTYPYCFKTYTIKAPKQCKSHYSCSNINSLSMLSQIQVFIFWVNNIFWPQNTFKINWLCHFDDVNNNK